MTGSTGAGHAFDPTVLREYDIRGVVGRTLHEADAFAVGRSFASILRRRAVAGADGDTRGEGDPRAAPPAPPVRIAVGYDGRLSSPMLEAALVAGLRASGADVVRIGLGPSPMLYFAGVSMEDVAGGVQVTGSHNPGDHNGFKMVAGGAQFAGADIAALGRVAAAGEWLEPGPGAVEPAVESREILSAYVDRLLAGLDGADPIALAGLRIGWDAGNGAAGPALEALTARLPGEHHLLYTAIDGHFPHHHPDPTVEANLAELKALVAAKSLHFGVAFDGDGDRIGVVDALGRVLWGDQLLMILAEDLLRERPGAAVIADVKSSAALFDRIAALGGQPVMWKTGHSALKSKLAETGALLAGEMSGHMFYADRWYGFDDALYAAVRLIAATARLGRSVTELRAAMPELVATPDLRIAVDEARKFLVVDEVAARLAAAGADTDATDGVRVCTGDGWWLLRASNTEAAVTVRAESTSEAGLARLLVAVDAQLALSGVERRRED